MFNAIHEREQNSPVLNFSRTPRPGHTAYMILRTFTSLNFNEIGDLSHVLKIFSIEGLFDRSFWIGTSYWVSHECPHLQNGFKIQLNIIIIKTLFCWPPSKQRFTTQPMLRRNQVLKAALSRWVATLAQGDFSV